VVLAFAQVKPHRIWDAQGFVRAVEEFHGREQQIGVTDILYGMDHVFALSVIKMLRLTLVMLRVDDPAVLEISTRNAGVVSRPEIVEHVAMKVAALARGKVEVPYAHTFVFRDEHRPDAAVETVVLELLLE
jgi:hypothetical protein